MRLSAPVYQLKRKARLLSRTDNIPLHEALDRIAVREGFAAWSLLLPIVILSVLAVIGRPFRA